MNWIVLSHTCRRVVGGRGLHLDGVVAVAKLCQSKASDFVERVDAGQEFLVMPACTQP